MNVQSNKKKEITKEDAYILCQKYLGEFWLDTDLEDFEFRPFKGGLSNTLYHCFLSKNCIRSAKCRSPFPKEILLRIYGTLQESVERVVQETAVCTLLSERNLFPKLYGIFEYGRLEEYIPSRSLKRPDIRKFSQEIAVQVAKIHSMRMPILKAPSTLMSYLFRWLKFEEETADNTENKTVLPEIVADRTIRTELIWLVKQMDKIASPVVFCQNDLQGGNILQVYNKERTESGIMIIDFEYSCYNYRAYDIANHFCMRCFTYDDETHPRCDIDIKYLPDEEEQLIFIEAYLKELKRNGTFQGTIAELEQEKLKILKEVEIFILLSSLVGCIWGYNGALTSAIEFDHLDYAAKRWEMYKMDKKELLMKNPQIGL